MPRNSNAEEIQPITTEEEGYHILATELKPDIPISEDGLWVAVVLHDKTLKEIEKEEDFLWIKCHRRITFRTLKHMYFSRFPLAEFKLKHRTRYPDDSEQLKELCIKDDVTDRLVVLRAIPFDDETDEMEYIYGSPVREHRTHITRSKKPHRSIINESNEPEERDDMNSSASDVHTLCSAQHSRKRVRKVVEEEDSSAESGESGHDPLTKNSKVVSTYITVKHAEDSKRSSLVHCSDTAPIFQADDVFREPSPKLPSKSISLKPTFPSMPQPGFIDSSNLLKMSQPIDDAVFNTDEWFDCACGKRAHWRKWTEFDTEMKPMCTRCSHTKHVTANNTEAIHIMTVQIQETRYLKLKLQSEGNSQSLEDDDAPECHTRATESTNPIVSTSSHTECNVALASTAEIDHVECALPLQFDDQASDTKHYVNDDASHLKKSRDTSNDVLHEIAAAAAVAAVAAVSSSPYNFNDGDQLGMNPQTRGEEEDAMAEWYLANYEQYRLEQQESDASSTTTLLQPCILAATESAPPLSSPDQMHPANTSVSSPSQKEDVEGNGRSGNSDAVSDISDTSPLSDFDRESDDDYVPDD